MSLNHAHFVSVNYIADAPFTHEHDHPIQLSSFFDFCQTPTTKNNRHVVLISFLCRLFQIPHSSNMFKYLQIYKIPNFENENTFVWMISFQI